MQIMQLRYFIAIVDKHSFSEAARECFVTQPNLSQHMRALEKELKVPLFIRKGRSFEVTPAGKLLYQRALQIIHEMDNLVVQVQRVNRNLGSTLRLGLLSSMEKGALPQVLSEQVLNRTGLELELFYGSHDELYDLFGNGSINAFVSDERRLASSQSFSKVSLFTTKLQVELPKSLELPPHPSGKPKVELSALHGMTLIIACESEHFEDECHALEQLLHFERNYYGRYQYIPSLAEGRRLLQSHEGSALSPSALLVDKSLLKHAHETPAKLTRYELLAQGKAIKRRLCCYARKNLGAAELGELCTIIMELGGVKRDLSGYQENYQESYQENYQASYHPDHYDHPELDQGPEPSFGEHSIPL